MNFSLLTISTTFKLHRLNINQTTINFEAVHNLLQMLHDRTCQLRTLLNESTFNIADARILY
jgi:hypothetical protein